MNAFCVVSDSGTLPEESSFFTSVGHPFPAVCIRTSTERPEALDKGDFILAGIDGDHLLQAVDVAVEMNKNRDLGIPVPDYVDENVSDKVVKIIQSYTGVVNKMGVEKVLIPILRNDLKEYILYGRYQTKTSKDVGECEVGDCLYTVYSLFKRIGDYNSSNLHQTDDNRPNWRG